MDSLSFSPAGVSYDPRRNKPVEGFIFTDAHSFLLLMQAGIILLPDFPRRRVVQIVEVIVNEGVIELGPDKVNDAGLGFSESGTRCHNVEFQAMSNEQGIVFPYEDTERNRKPFFVHFTFLLRQSFEEDRKGETVHMAQYRITSLAIEGKVKHRVINMIPEAIAESTACAEATEMP